MVWSSLSEGLPRPALIDRPRNTLCERAATLDERHEALLELDRELAIFGCLPHVRGPRSALLFRNLESVVCTSHDGKAAALLGVQRRPTKQFGHPQSEALGVFLALIAEERRQQRVREKQFVEPRRQTLHCRSTTGEFVQATHLDTHQIGTVRFELTTPRSQSECATRLRHVPLWVEPLRSLDSRDCAETLDLANGCQLTQRLDFDLSNALAG